MNELGQQQEPQYPKSQQEDYSKPTIQHCQFPICPIHSNSKYCIRRSAGSVIPEKVKLNKGKINQVSDKRKEDKKEYLKIVAEMLAENPNCDIKETGCQTLASGLHHQKKRSPATYLDKRFLIRACSSCNLWVELFPLVAIAKGYSVSKFKK